LFGNVHWVVGTIVGVFHKTKDEGATMNEQVNSTMSKVVFLAQLFSVLFIWVFVCVITVWIVNLIQLSLELNDAPGASVGISIVAIPVFITLASVLTYVFVGLQREKSPTSTTEEK